MRVMGWFSKVRYSSFSIADFITRHNPLTVINIKAISCLARKEAAIKFGCVFLNRHLRKTFLWFQMICIPRAPLPPFPTLA